MTALQDQLPVTTSAWSIGDKPTGLVIVDEVHGFCTVGAGPLAPAAPNAQVTRMIEETDRIARRFVAEGRPILAFLETHEPGKVEIPYPPHCERGSGHEELVDELTWLESEPLATLIRKDCINGFVGAIEAAHPGHGVTHNRVIDWVALHRLKAIVVVGICTDICVMDFVCTMMSARNHGLLPTLDEVVVLEPACSTYDLPLQEARSMGLPDTSTHPQELAHHMGLYMMAARGATLASAIEA
ncbi:MAG TPA: isochorismatase family protein [Geminicoccus sp.]|uniref:isochorismatase family protein n=1 Tax=Geminicoccus sp. TaxID=2024832 RepID=UPI002E2F7585|nr:isochorismatase family protein [Geminicoccus sp.]HEX2527076.1 isochorismatase family protein [Geminicoccus sp.]